MTNSSSSERRNDIGNKLSWLLIAAMIAGFAGVAWASSIKGIEKADEALKQVSEARVEIAVIKANYQAINYRLDEIKSLIKNTGIE